MHEVLLDMLATWNGQVLADSDQTVVVEGNHYFPPDSVNRDFFAPNAKTSVCGWKGTAEYLDIAVDGEVYPAGAWYYDQPKDAAGEIKGHLAFYGNVTVG